MVGLSMWRNPYYQLQQDVLANLLIEMIYLYQGRMNCMVSGVFTFQSQLLIWFCAQASQSLMH